MTGEPRTQYVRVYNVIPEDASDERAIEIFLEGWQRAKETAGGSYDDAGVGDLVDKTAVLWDIPPGKQPAFTHFYNEFYPTVDVIFRDGDLPEPEWKPLRLTPPRPGSYRALARFNDVECTFVAQWTGSFWVSGFPIGLMAWDYLSDQ